MIGPLALAFAALAAAQPADQQAAPAPVPRDDLPRHVIFAWTRLDGWRVEAKTDVDDVGGFPIIESASCEMKRSGLAITTWLDAGLWIRLGDTSVEPDLGFRNENIRRIVLGDRAWEYRWRRTRYERDHFRNLSYPPPPAPCGYGCIGAFSYDQAIRRRPGQPWLAPELLGNEFLRARMLRIGFQDPDAPEGRPGPMLWAEIPLTGLGRAIAWCRSALGSEAARRFHNALEEE